MAFSSGKQSGPMAEINVTPLVDVMLVLLIIFMITAPQPTNKVIVDLPQKTTNPPPTAEEPPEPISLLIKANGDLYWNDSLLPFEALDAQLKVELAKDAVMQPQLRIDAEDATQYQLMADVLAVIRKVGYKKLGFLNMN